MLYPNICISAMSTGGLLPGETGCTAEVPEEAMEFLAPVLETMVAEEATESSIPGPEVVAFEEEIEPLVPASKTISLEVEILDQEDIGIATVEPGFRFSERVWTL